MSLNHEEAGAMITDDADREQVLRDKAVRRLKKQRDFGSHLLVYVLVNTFLVVIWLLTDPHGFFWPVLPIAGWGIGVIMNAWDVTAARRSPRRTSTGRWTAWASRALATLTWDVRLWAGSLPAGYGDGRRWQ
jgi:hypothetical protein